MSEWAHRILNSATLPAFGLIPLVGLLVMIFVVSNRSGLTEIRGPGLCQDAVYSQLIKGELVVLIHHRGALDYRARYLNGREINQDVKCDWAGSPRKTALEN